VSTVLALIVVGGSITYITRSVTSGLPQPATGRTGPSRGRMAAAAVVGFAVTTARRGRARAQGLREARANRRIHRTTGGQRARWIDDRVGRTLDSAPPLHPVGEVVDPKEIGVFRRIRSGLATTAVLVLAGVLIAAAIGAATVMIVTRVQNAVS